MVEKRIWVVEDNEDNMDIMRRFIGYMAVAEVSVFVNPSGALDELKRVVDGVGPNLVILDYQFLNGGLTARDLIEGLREVFTDPLVVMWSADHESRDLRELVEENPIVCEKVLKKPVEKDQVAAVLREFGFKMEGGFRRWGK